MKSPKTFLLLSVIVAVLVLGVAYASIQANLNIVAQATVAPDSSNFKVSYTSNIVKSPNSELVVAGASGRTASVTIGAGVLTKLGDTATVTFEVENTSDDLAATLGEITPSNVTGDEYITFSAVYGGETTLAAKTGKTTVVVTATLIKQPVAEQTASATFSFVAEAVEA